MKKSLILCAALLLLATGCSNNKKGNESTVENNSSKVIKETDVVDFDDDFEESFKADSKNKPASEKAEKKTDNSSSGSSGDTSDKSSSDKSGVVIGDKLDSFEDAELNDEEMDQKDKEELQKQSTGKFVITLYADKAPITCQNFEKLVSEGFYNGLDFFRVTEGAMAFGGDPAKCGSDKKASPIKGEFKENGVENDLCFDKGVVGMIREDDPDSATSGFFICYSDLCVFDGYYAAFGKVTEGMETVDAFTTVPMKKGDGETDTVPVTPIIIKSAKMISDDKDGNHRVEFEMENFIK